MAMTRVWIVNPPPEYTGWELRRYDDGGPVGRFPVYITELYQFDFAPNIRLDAYFYKNTWPEKQDYGKGIMNPGPGDYTWHYDTGVVEKRGVEDVSWLPMPPAMGPPLPRFLGILWPWHTA